jgi:Domain of unknown function (DU1801)
VDAVFQDPAVEAVFRAYPAPLRARLLHLRRLILETAAEHAEVGELDEALRWGQPSYLTTRSKAGSTLRIDQVKAPPGRYALYFNCKTDLGATFRDLYPDVLEFGGNRSLLFNASDPVPDAALRHCIALALTYHRRKRAVR